MATTGPSSGVTAGLLLGAGLDALLGDPRRGHPVAAFGRWAGWLEAHLYRPDRAAGALATTAALAPLVVLGLASRRLPPPARTAAMAAVTWVALGGTSLRREALAVHDHLARGDLSAARTQVRNLVGRTTDQATADDVARASIESVAENTSDAVVATLVWGALLGPTGVLLHRGSNTLDAMWGHRSERYASFGWAAARLDDVLGWAPARVTVLAAALASATGRSPRRASAADVLRAARRDGPAHPSPNAGPVEAGFAAGLGLTLGGRTVYGERVEERPLLGGGPAPTTADIPRATQLAGAVGLWALVLTAGGRALPRLLRRGRQARSPSADR